MLLLEERLELGVLLARRRVRPLELERPGPLQRVVHLPVLEGEDLRLGFLTAGGEDDPERQGNEGESPPAGCAHDLQV